MKRFIKHGQCKNKRNQFWPVVVVITASFLMVGCNVQNVSATSDLPFDMPMMNDPVIPNRTFLITDYGAVADGHTKNTQAFKKAIRACADAGGGKLVVPAGLWLTGPIELTSQLEFHLAQGAVVLFSDDIDDYPLVDKTFEGRRAVRRMSPLTGNNLEHVAFTGSGIFDGSGQVWRPVKKEKLTAKQWKKLVSSGGVLDSAKKIWHPTQQALDGPKIVDELDKRNADVNEYAAAGHFLRPTLVSLVNCKHVLLDGPTFQNSPGWNIHPLMCENMIVRNITVRNPWWSQNGDGLDLESCRNVQVYNCRFDVGDDAICMKSGRNEYGRRRGKPTENVDIRDCVVYHGHGGFVIGSEMSGGVRNISVRNCDFLGTDVGLRFKSTRGRGGVVENIYIEDIRMKEIPTDAIRFNLFYETKSPGPEQTLEIKPDPVTEETPRFQNIYLKNITCHGAKNAIYMQGLPEMPVRNISFENVKISADAGFTGIFADQIEFKNVAIIPEEGASFNLYGCTDMMLENIDFSKTEGSLIKLVGDTTDRIHLKNIKTSLDGRIEFGRGVDKDILVKD